MHDVTPWDHLLALFAGLVLPLGGALLQRGREASREPWTSRDRIAMYWTNSAVLALLAGATLLVWHLGGHSPSTLGLTAEPRRLDVGLGGAALFLALYAFDSLRQIGPARLAQTRRRWRRDTPFMPTTPRELGHSLVMITSAAVFEEIVYRGFLISYAAQFTGATPLGLAAAVILPALVFGLGHLYQGWRAGGKIVFLAGFLGAIFVLTGSLWIPMALHFVADLVGFLLGPRLLGDEQ